MMSNVYYFFFVFVLCFRNVFFAIETDHSILGLKHLWSSIEDPNNPTWEEYKRIDGYLREKRDFLEPISLYDEGRRLSHFSEFQLLGPHDEMPLFEKHSFRVTEKTKHRCLLIYASGNGDYGKKASQLLKNLQEIGYSGHVLMRVGGFPDAEHGGLKLCHIPYAFKLQFFKEAERLHFKEVLWLDLSMHPLTDLDMIFSEIQRNGYFLLKISSLLENKEKFLKSAAESLSVSYEEYSNIPHISSALLGLDLSSAKALELLSFWEMYTKEPLACVTWHPDDLSLSVAAYRSRCTPFCWYGKIVCAKDEVEWLTLQRPSIQVYFEKVK